MGKFSIVTVAVLAFAVVLMVVVLPLAAVAAQMRHGDHAPTDSRTPPEPEEAAPLLDKLYSEQLPMLSAAIEKAIKAVQSDDTIVALDELNKAKEALEGVDQSIKMLVKPVFSNVRCPMMGSPINPDKTSEALVRDYKGKKVAFCCQGCPEQWDKLTDAEKSAKLADMQPARQGSGRAGCAGRSAGSGSGCGY